MDLALGGNWPIFEMQVLVYSGTDPDTIAAVTAFNQYFSITFEFGILAFICTMISTILARS